ncbi:hypothetical protein FN846DRAFT_715430 [Sphaerosporella brunnea]|uniref:Secreted protein n=1 Tax=Sphaerosporella brunnea TaxID=1250544 RepID=A0A5J5EX24_9PEZI|nr:hypothetical protein FN846DRAFT_715430 [Sphaerosporella brunnea]
MKKNHQLASHFIWLLLCMSFIKEIRSPSVQFQLTVGKEGTPAKPRGCVATTSFHDARVSGGTEDWSSCLDGGSHSNRAANACIWTEQSVGTVVGR